MRELKEFLRIEEWVFGIRCGRMVDVFRWTLLVWGVVVLVIGRVCRGVHLLSFLVCWMFGWSIFLVVRVGVPIHCFILCISMEALCLKISLKILSQLQLLMLVRPVRFADIPTLLSTS